jgi:hypothetical protein
MTCRFIPCFLCLAGHRRRPAAARSTGTRVPSGTAQASPVFLASRTALRSFGARAASSAAVWFTCLRAVAVPAPDPAASPANVSPLRRQAKTSRACCPGFSFRRADPVEARQRRTIPAT